MPVKHRTDDAFAQLARTFWTGILELEITDVAYQTLIKSALPTLPLHKRPLRLLGKFSFTMTEPTIPTPPQTPPSNVPPSSPDPLPSISLARLDSLLETYLDFLDQYTTLRTQLSKQFSDGFFALARANHTSPSLGGGRRFGGDGYDERMKAQRRVVYTVEDSRGGSDAHRDESEEIGRDGDQVAALTACRVSIQKTKHSSPSEETSTGSAEQADYDDTPDHSSTGASSTPPISSPTPTKRDSSSKASTEAKAKRPPSHRDPLNWYGILVPQALRQAQACFTAGVETSIPQLLNTSAAMRELETSISKLRVELGLQPGLEPDLDVEENAQVQEEEPSSTNPSSQPPRTTIDASQISTSPRKRLVQRTSEPRSRILRLDG